MVHIDVCGIDVDFPFEPYECQKRYMEKVITCLQKGIHGVLESPTGTGKTLCLLCATLAWRETYAARLQYERSGQKQNTDFSEQLGDALNSVSGSLNPGGSWERGFVEAPQIIYASRTHSQLSQAVNELKNTRYSPKICVLGSREQMCINSEVMKEETNNGKVHMCRIKVAGKQCFYHNNLEASKASVPTGVLDIEDLVAAGTEKKFCPYYMAREMRKEADLIFMPYNYVLHVKARNAHSIDLNNTVILLDEAHNVESVCEENSSFDLTSFDLASCIEDCQHCIETLLQQEEDGTMQDEASPGDLTAEDTSLMKTLFLKLEAAISEVELDKNDSVTKPASFLLDLLNQLNVNSQSKDQIMDTLEKMSGLIAGSSRKVFKARNYALDKFATILKTMFSRNADSSSSLSSNLPIQKYYKVHIQAEQNEQKNKKRLDVWTSKSNSSKEAPRTLSYWCFNPGLTMQELVAHGVRSLILTSGTLSPLSSFKAELSIAFDVELENSHVIERHQVFVGILPQGPDGKPLNSSYKFRSTPEYQVSLGNTIVNLARIIPHGLLVFFPSYPVMDMVIAKWQGCGIWDRLSQNKGLFIEPRRKSGLAETMEQFYEKVHDPNLKGAVFFAVCRGKVSEGLDFADTNGRAVVITGLPFPPSFDPRVILKKQYLDEQKNKVSISGKDWYRQQASRAVNQAIGRVIRHKNDFGAILLCDERFRNSDAKSHLPVWIKQQIKEYKDFGQAQRDLAIFFKETQQKMGVVEPKQKRKFDTISNESDQSSTKTKALKTYYSASVHNSNNNNNNNKLSFGSNTMLNSAAKNSLFVLKADKQAKGSIFESLRRIEGAAENSGGLQCSSLSSTILGSNVVNPQPKTKKYRLVTSANVEKKMGGGEKKLKVQNAKEYLSKVKKTLPKDKYEKFGQVMKMFKQSGNIKTLMKEFEDVFDRTDLEHISLLEGFSFFIGKESDKKYFEEACEKFSATQCIICLEEAYKPHAPPCCHFACYACWVSSKKPGLLKCPKCDSSFKWKQLQKSYIDGQLGLYGYDFSKFM